jgi:Fe-S-cluster-containing hydrogenase component 2
MAVKIVKEMCPQNHSCPAVRTCPEKALVQNGYSAPVIEQEKCLDCGKCVENCPMGALQFS